ncbi:sigma-E processing peptidase SpoIIGA [Caldinitratiruptor microaerophilus]|uniref:Sigma-E processing peptidase SpoIIGA n=1 Tax=Caldinitratiruptor microaerophilus TaxID=671077 RepID=A0AA35CK19_9FIRM|nr:sigma-E processing peptidase SpoIIGA [Caldinitratiruptor microaerophilus]BDG60749.1 hypothetical protein caldi_18390 [Caldinitratiruptor microaerophilus]
MPLVRVVDVDVVFGLSLVVDGLWLWAAGVMAGVRVRPLRLLAAAAAGALADVVAAFPGGAALRGWGARMAGSLLLLTLGYGGTVPVRSLGRLLLYFYAAGAAIAGAAVLLGSGVPRGVAVYRAAQGYVAFSVPLAPSPLILAGAALVLAGGRLVLDSARVWRRARPDLVALRVAVGGEQVTVRALVDTGNRLHDPAGGVPVVVAERRALAPLLPPALRVHPLDDPAGAAAALPAAWARRVRLVPFRSLGTPSGLLIAIRPDRLEVQGWSRAALVALTPEPLDPAGRFQALVPGALLEDEAAGGTGSGLGTATGGCWGVRS